MLRRLPAMFVVIVVVSSACSSSTLPTTSTSPPSTTSAPTTPSATTLPPNGTTEPGTGLDPELVESLRAEVDALSRIAEEIRGLAFIEEPTVVFLTETELAARIVADFEAELEPGELEWTEAWFDLLGLLDPDMQPLAEVYADLLSEQVVGVYEPETKELLVRADTANLSVFSKTTVVHEMIHALSDQHFGVGERLEALVEEDHLDEASAYISLLEGEATYFQFVYIADHLSPSEAVALGTEIIGSDSTVLDRTPFVISEPLLFRYEAGFQLVLDIIEDLGIEGINEALRSPPLTTEHVAHPAAYFDEEPAVQVVLPSIVAPGYEVVEESTWGELGLLATFGQVIGEGAASQIGGGWGGDTYRVLYNGSDVIFLFSYRADTDRDATEVAEAFVDLATNSMDAGDPTDGEDSSTTFSGEDFAFVEVSGDSVVFVAASDPAAGEAAAGALNPP
ncbi:MAG: hypothetical protein V3R84_05620 [Acidimicrobiia bacterium]